MLSTPTPMKRTTGPASARRATPRRSSIAVRTMSTRESGSSTQSTGTSWMRRPRRWARTSSSVSKNQPVVADVVEQAPGRRRGHGLEAALRIGEARAQDGVQQGVVGARDELALGAAHDARRASEAAADGEVAVPREQRRDQREQAAQVRRQVDVHVAEDLGIAARPCLAQGAPAALAVDAQQLDPRQLVRQRLRDGGRGVGARVVGDDDPPGERELGAQVAVQPAHAALERGLLVEDRHHDLDARGAVAGAGRALAGRGAGERLLGHGHSVGARRGTTVGGG